MTIGFAWLSKNGAGPVWHLGWTPQIGGEGWFNAARTTVTALGALGIGGAAYIAFRRQAAKEVEGTTLSTETNKRSRVLFTIVRPPLQSSLDTRALVFGWPAYTYWRR